MDSSTEDMDSKEAEVDQDVIAGSSDATEVPAESATMLDAVTAALAGKDDKEASATSEPDKAQTAPKAAEVAEGDKAKPDEISDEDLKRTSQGVQKRIRRLVKEREKFESEASELRPKAEQLDFITKQIQQTGLNQDDLGVIFDIGTALKRGDLFGARKALAPIWEAVNEATGGVIPKDLLPEVQGGQITAQRAHELAVARAAANQAAYQGRQQAERQATERTQQATAAVVNSVNDWEKSKAASDPDWKLKAPEIMRSLQYSLRVDGQKATTPEQGIALAEKALAEVNERFRQFRPPPRAVRAVVSSGGASPRSNAAPKTMLDVINSVVG